MVMGVKFNKWLFTVLILTTIAVISITVLPIHRALIGIKHVGGPTRGYLKVSQEIELIPIPSGVEVFAIGSPGFIQGLVNAGVPQGIITPISVSNVINTPPRSIIAIDWTYLFNYTSSNMTITIRILKHLFINRDIVIIGVSNVSQLITTELILAKAWAKAYNASAVAVPVPRYGVGDMMYVLAVPIGHRALMIGPANTISLNEKLITVLKLLYGVIPTVQNQVDPDDPCYAVASSFSASTQQTTNVSNGYFFWYGQQIYSDSYGSEITDFCIEIGQNIAGEENGYTYIPGYEWNFIASSPASGVYVNSLLSFVDQYASYMCSQGVMEPDVFTCSYRNTPVGWFSWAGANPGPISPSTSTSVSYQISIAIGFSATGPTGQFGNAITEGYTINDPPIEINLTAPQYTNTPDGGGAYNETWVLAPTNPTAAVQQNQLGTEILGPMIVYPFLTTQINVPAGVQAVLYSGSGSSCSYESVVYDVQWFMFYPSPPNMQFQVINVGTAGPSTSSPSGFYVTTYTSSCPQ
ncbi:hypothetical protein [Vulcanisaeta sp. JCM 14467]|uniref:hypothetical protein n=1 Tax=Vulcanisaeta sp. JCM 14467 TaxID=1295370 RepID=UPI0006D0E15F|nr:hypothetical protein [Vulcanisaeta sp. JCM 14467]